MYFYFAIAIFVFVVIMQNKTRGLKNSIDKLIKQSARYATTAQQDSSPVMYKIWLQKRRLIPVQIFLVKLMCTYLNWPPK